METNKEVIINIIVQDMRLNQYKNRLKKLGIEVYGYDPDFIGIVAKLMELPDEMFNDNWVDLYAKWISKCDRLTIMPDCKNLQPLAQNCYTALLKFMKNPVPSP